MCLCAAAAKQQSHVDIDDFTQSTETALRLLYSTSFQVGLASCLPVTLNSTLTGNSTGDENVLDPGDKPLMFALFLETDICLYILTCQQTHSGTREILWVSSKAILDSLVPKCNLKK